MRELVAEEINQVSGGWDNYENPTDPNFGPTGFDEGQEDEAIEELGEIMGIAGAIIGGGIGSAAGGGMWSCGRSLFRGVWNGRRVGWTRCRVRTC